MRPPGRYADSHTRTDGGGSELRMAATALAVLARAGRDEHAAVLALTVALAGLVDAIADLRAVQGRAEQAAGARAASGLLGTTSGPGPARAAMANQRAPAGTDAATAGASPPPRPATVKAPLFHPPRAALAMKVVDEQEHVADQDQAPGARPHHRLEGSCQPAP